MSTVMMAFGGGHGSQAESFNFFSPAFRSSLFHPTQKNCQESQSITILPQCRHLIRAPIPRCRSLIIRYRRACPDHPRFGIFGLLKGAGRKDPAFIRNRVCSWRGFCRGGFVCPSGCSGSGDCHRRWPVSARRKEVGRPKIREWAASACGLRTRNWNELACASCAGDRTNRWQRQAEPYLSTIRYRSG